MSAAEVCVGIPTVPSVHVCIVWTVGRRIIRDAYTIFSIAFSIIIIVCHYGLMCECMTSFVVWCVVLRQPYLLWPMHSSHGSLSLLIWIFVSFISESMHSFWNCSLPSSPPSRLRKCNHNRLTCIFNQFLTTQYVCTPFLHSRSLRHSLLC